MIDLWSYRLAARWRRWSVNQYVLRAWVRDSSLTSNFLRTPELNSVGTKTDVYLILLITHQKTCQVTKNWIKNRHAKHWSSSKQNSQATKRWKISRCSRKNWMANILRFAIKTIQGTDFCKTWGYFFARFFPHTTIVSQRKQYKVRFSLIFCFASVDSFKALTGYLEKLEILAKRFGL